MKNTVKAFTISAIISFIAVLALAFFSTNTFAEDITDPSANPVTIIQQQKILLADEVMAETRTFRYAAGVAGGALGVWAGATAAATAGVSVLPAAVASGIVYGAAFYGASTLGIELAYQTTAAQIREKRDRLMADMKKKSEEGVNKGKELGDDLEKKFKEWF